MHRQPPLFAPRSAGNSDLAVVAALLGILFVILVPLPTWLIDGLLVVNVVASLLILMTTACLSAPLEFSVFPSVLLIATFFRLALNIGTTRLILGGDGGATAAGGVIEAFSTFVAGSNLGGGSGSNLIVGLIVFAIIMVVQFVVITKGTTRVSEVTARFTLDAMPGKQMSIDSDLAAGLIDDATARERRREVSRQAEFYGAMDGASKFVRGEALAGLVITLVNVGAGFLVGVFHHGFSVGDSAEIFTRLTIGDGLVSQIPALMVSVATALIVTKNAAGENLGRDLWDQLFANDRILFMVSAFLLLLIPSGIPAEALILGAILCGGFAFHLRRRRTSDERGEFEDEEEEFALETGEAAGVEQEDVRSLLAVESIELELGFRLVGLVDEERGGDLLERIARVRERVAIELGFVLPPIRVHDNIRVRPTEYTIRLRGNSLGCWRVYPDRWFALRGPGVDDDVELEGISGRDPLTGEAGVWIDDDRSPAAGRAGWTVRSVAELLSDHLESFVRSHSFEILSREEVARLVADLRTRAPVVVDELIPAQMKLGQIHRVLEELLRENVSVRDLETILTALADAREAGVTEIDGLVARVRRALARTICGSVADAERRIHGRRIDPELEDFLAASIQSEARRFALAPGVAESLAGTLAASLSAGVDRAGGVVLCSAAIRAPLQRLLRETAGRATVIAYDEVCEGYRIESAGSIRLEELERALS